MEPGSIVFNYYFTERKVMISSLKKTIATICPKPLLEILVVLVRKSRMIRADLEMIFHPKKTVFYCPCCNKRIKTFVSGHFIERPLRFNSSRYIHIRQDVLCPICKSLPRHRILASWCQKHKKLLRSSHILYFAPEYSMILWMNRNKISYTTADLNAQADLKLDIQNTGLPDKSCDMIICNHVLEHVDDFRLALKEIHRILRPYGTFICSFPMDSKIELIYEDPTIQTDKERLKHFGQNDHKRVFGMKADIYLKEAGFKVKKICGDNYPNEILPVIGPADYDMNILFRCRKDR